VILSIADTGQGVDELWQAAKAHKQFLVDENLLDQRRSLRIKAELSEIVADIARRNLENSMESDQVRTILSKIVGREVDPHTAARDLLPTLLTGSI